jgi:CheY-like chemotaxis protein
MSPQVQAKAFDPFFTTKSAGRGLGLAVVQGIVRSLSGAVNLASEPGTGTSFQILLPAVEGMSGAAAGALSDAAELATSSRCGSILVVEDEDILRQAVVKMLRRNGFEAFEAADGSSAIDLLRADGGKFDLILLDMTIPEASSDEIVAEAANRPNIRIVLTSAYSREMVARDLSPQIRSFVRKPFHFGELLKTLRSSLT